jgi:hypothetical protein
MPDMRLAYAACWVECPDPDRDTFVIGPDDERICYIPAIQAPFIQQRRSKEDRWDIATLIARLLNEESQRCAVGEGEAAATNRALSRKDD